MSTDKNTTKPVARKATVSAVPNMARLIALAGMSRTDTALAIDSGEIDQSDPSYRAKVEHDASETAAKVRARKARKLAQASGETHVDEGVRLARKRETRL